MQVSSGYFQYLLVVPEYEGRLIYKNGTKYCPSKADRLFLFGGLKKDDLVVPNHFRMRKCGK